MSIRVGLFSGNVFQERAYVKGTAMANSPNKLSHHGAQDSIGSLITLAYWQLRQTWRLLLVTGGSILLAVVLVCTIPLYTQVSISAGLRDALATSSDASYITVHSTSVQISVPIIQNTETQLTNLFHKYLGPYIDSSPQLFLQVPSLVVGSGLFIRPVGVTIDQALQHARLIKGRLPAQSGNQIEIAITPEAAQYFQNALHLHIGSTFTLHISFNVPYSTMFVLPPLTIRIVGIFTPTRTNDAFWHHETFAAEPTPGGATVLPVLVSNQAFLSELTQLCSQEALSHLVLTNPIDLFWYYPLATSHLDVNSLDDPINKLNTALVGVNADNALTRPPFVENVTSIGPNQVLADYRNRLTVHSIPMLTVACFTVGLLLYFIGLMTDLLVDRQSEAVALLRSRGGSRRQIFAAFSLQGAAVGLIALISGPFLALISARLLVQHTLSPLDQGALNLILQNPAQVIWGICWLAFVTTGASIFTMLLSIGRAVRLDTLATRREASRSTHRPFWQRLRLDVVAILISLLAFGFSTYITTPGIVDVRVRVLLLPPATLIGTALLLLGLALLFLRYFPVLLRLIARLAALNRGASPLLALAQLARSPRQTLRMTLLLTLAVAFTIFAFAFNASQAQRLSDATAFQVGSDFNGLIPAAVLTRNAEQQETGYQHLPGVISATIGYSSSVIALPDTLKIPVELRAVDADTYAKTVIWTQQDSSQSIDTLMTQLSARRAWAAQQKTVPVIVDAVAWTQMNLSVGARFSIIDGENRMNFIAVAEVNSIPTVEDSRQTSGTGDDIPSGGILADYASYNAVSLATNTVSVTPNIVWLRTHDDTASLTGVRKALSDGYWSLDNLEDRRAILNSLNSDPLYLTLRGVLMIGVIAVLLVSIVGIIIVSWLSIRNRLTNFVVMRALGVTLRQLTAILLWEQAVAYTTAIGIGAAIGIFLSRMVLPALVFTNLTLGQVDTGQFYVLQAVPPIRTVIPVSSLGITLGMLVAIFLFAIGMMIHTITHPSMSSTLRLSVD
jgi:putative ABC transport system permease protein